MKIETHDMSIGISLVYNDEQRRLIEIQVKNPWGQSELKMAYPLAKLFLRDFQRIVALCREDPGKIKDPPKFEPEIPESEEPAKKSRFKFLSKLNDLQK